MSRRYFGRGAAIVALALLTTLTGCDDEIPPGFTCSNDDVGCWRGQLESLERSACGCALELIPEVTSMESCIDDTFGDIPNDDQEACFREALADVPEVAELLGCYSDYLRSFERCISISQCDPEELLPCFEHEFSCTTSREVVDAIEPCGPPLPNFSFSL